MAIDKEGGEILCNLRPAKQGRVVVTGTADFGTQSNRDGWKIIAHRHVFHFGWNGLTSLVHYVGTPVTKKV